MRIKDFTLGKRTSIYGNYNKEQLLDMFQSNNWNKLNSFQRMQLLEAVGDTYAKEIGLKNRPIFLPTFDKSAYGKYTKYAIKINLGKCSNPYKALDTTVHELNHAYQMQCIKEKTGKYSEGELAILKAQSDKGYIDRGEEYLRQSIEVDSNNAGLEYLLSERERFQSDPAYTEFLKLKYGDYEEINDDYQKNRAKCDAVEYGQIADAFLGNEISVQERDTAEECILKNQNSIKQQCTYLREDVKKNFFECALLRENDKYQDNHWSQEQIYEDVINRAKERHQIFDNRKDSLSTVHDWKKIDEIKGLLIDNHLMKKSIENVMNEFVKQRETAMKKLSNRIISHNMSLSQSKQDMECQRLSKEIKECDQKISNCKYHIAELNTDNQLISESTKIEIEDYQGEKKTQTEKGKEEGLEVKNIEESSENSEKLKETENVEDMDDGLENDVKAEGLIETPDMDDGLESDVKAERLIETPDMDDGLESDVKAEGLIETPDMDDGLETNISNVEDGYVSSANYTFSNQGSSIEDMSSLSGSSVSSGMDVSS